MRVIGLISGTSIDGIDAALVDISGSTTDLRVQLIAGQTYLYPADLRAKLLAVADGQPISMAEFADLDDAVAEQFAAAAIAIQTGQPPAELIGSHGQTVYHRPPRTAAAQTNTTLGYSLQIGRGCVIADRTGITTINNFRAADIAAGGQGAPLVSAIDTCLLAHPTENRCVQNIGGIGNVTYLPARHERTGDRIQGWDTGPGNMLLDLAVQHFSNGSKTYDEDGAWAATGIPCAELVNQWLQHAFLQQPPPKSTGRELYGSAYLEQCLADVAAYRAKAGVPLSDADVLATLTDFTAASIAHSYHHFLPQPPNRVLVCGGGSQNLYLKQRLQHHMGAIPVCTTDEAGLNAGFKEAIAFAVLAYWRQHGIPGNLPDVTGADKSVLLGEIYQARSMGA